MDVLPVLRSPIRIELLELPFSSPPANARSRCSSFSLLTKYSPVAGFPTMKGGSGKVGICSYVGMVAYIGILSYACHGHDCFMKVQDPAKAAGSQPPNATMLIHQY